jgi:dTDP-4-amino-4,6-dideoxygalactose transaminase
MSGTITIPQANPGAGYRALKAEIDAAVARVLESGWYILGQEGRAFEAEFGAWLGGGAPGGTTAGTPGGTTIGCGNGTDAIALALRALGIGPGKAVATVSHTAVATVAAIEMAGATPILIDIDPTHYTMDPTALAAALEDPPPGLPPIYAVIAVHLYGQAADLRSILYLCHRHGIALIEDCAQAHGARLDDRKVGTFGDAATFSFYPTKNMGALGDGGAVVMRDADPAREAAALRQYGWHRHYISDSVGVNSRLDEMQAAILRVKLRHLDAQNARRQAIAAAYDQALAGSPLIRPARRAGAEHVFHLYVIRAAERDLVQARLREAGIGTGIHYPAPVHLQPAYVGRVAAGPTGLGETERAAREVLSLPLYPELTDEQVTRVCEALRAL